MTQHVWPPCDAGYRQRHRVLMEQADNVFISISSRKARLRKYYKTSSTCAFYLSPSFTPAVLLYDDRHFAAA
jgi:hypothetical protein